MPPHSWFHRFLVEQQSGRSQYAKTCILRTGLSADRNLLYGSEAQSGHILDENWKWSLGRRTTYLPNLDSFLLVWWTEGTRSDFDAFR